MKIYLYFKTLFIFSLVSYGSLFPNYAFKKKVKSICSSYRVPVESANMSLETNIFSLSLNSKRNNFEMVMLVGFASAGQAVSHQKSLALSNSYIPSTILIQVTSPMSKGQSMVIEGTCSVESSIALAEGKMDSAEFMKNIKIETL
tara:strand:- start:121 stop:555 length:435 start_codon:yes stop_codon:yes gene_type:complete